MYPLASWPIAVPCRTLARSTSPVDRWKKPKSLMIFLAIVPFPPPGGPMIRALRRPIVDAAMAKPDNPQSPGLLGR